MLDQGQRPKLDYEARIMEVETFEGFSLEEIVKKAFEIRQSTCVTPNPFRYGYEHGERRTAEIRFWKDTMAVLSALKELKRKV